jgi:hypothetical protein
MKLNNKALISYGSTALLYCCGAVALFSPNGASITLPYSRSWRCALHWPAVCCSRWASSADDGCRHRVQAFGLPLPGC